MVNVLCLCSRVEQLVVLDTVTNIEGVDLATGECVEASCERREEDSRKKARDVEREGGSA